MVEVALFCNLGDCLGLGKRLFNLIVCGSGGGDGLIDLCDGWVMGGIL
jgi:hypothetical protein